MIFSPSNNRFKNNNKLYCVCNNCANNQTYCLTDFVCYKLLGGSKNCGSEFCYGCFTNEIQKLQCDSTNENNINILCCNEYNYCNQNLTNPFQNSIGSNQTSDDINHNPSVIALGLSFSILSVFLVIITLITCCSKKAKNKSFSTSNESIDNLKIKLKKQALINRAKYFTHSLTNEFTKSTVCNDDKTINSLTSTGAGPCELIQRTIARDLHIDYSKGMIGHGRYGAVYTARWHHETVAVKVFFSMHEHSWSRETEIYQTCLLRHENILGYIASDIKGNGSSVNMILITDYHSLGSLYDYLQFNSVNKKLLVRFLYSICNGLNHLHQEIISTQYKPSIAHRDLKSKNILIKSNYECCLADFGLAVRFNSAINQLDYGCSYPKLITPREGTVRYMAPECLNDTIDVKCIDDFKKADMYQLSLVIWELLKCYQVNENDADVERHTPPYFEYVHTDPDLFTMRNIVCVKRIRPVFNRAFTEENIKKLVEIMKECWNENPNGRLNALIIKKKLTKIFSDLLI